VWLWAFGVMIEGATYARKRGRVNVTQPASAPTGIQNPMGFRTHPARSGAGKQGRAFVWIEYCGLKVRGRVRRIKLVKIGNAGRGKGRDQSGKTMMRAIQIRLWERIGRFSGGFLIFVFMVPGVGRLGFGGLINAILRNCPKRRLQRKYAKQK
jgi:hypothetical protein